MPIERASSPRNGVERAIASMRSTLRTILNEREGSDDFIGAEWWVQDVASDEPPKVFHTDCDVQTRNLKETEEGEEDVGGEESGSGSGSGGGGGGGGGGVVVAHPTVASVLYLSDVGAGLSTIIRTTPMYCSNQKAAETLRLLRVMFFSLLSGEQRC